MGNVKRNPVKQIMSEVHKDAGAGKVDLGGHDGFIAEVKRRLRAEAAEWTPRALSPA